MAKKQLFLRLGYTQYSKLGLRRKNKQKYRKAKGCDNKVRLKMKGHLRNVSIGFRSNREERGNVRELKPVHVHNIEELKKVGKHQIALFCKMGDRKKSELADYALKNNIKVFNVNPSKFLEEIKEKMEKRNEDKKKMEEKIKSKEKKAKETEKKEEKKEESKDEEKHTEHKHEEKTK